MYLSLIHIFAAVHRLYPKAHVCIEHALSNGLFCEVEQQGYLTPEDVFQIEQTMKEIDVYKRQSFDGGWHKFSIL